MFGALALATSSAASAHPHVWVTVACVFTVDAERRAVSVRQSWTYDEMYSSYALYGLDADGDGRYSAAELAALKDEMATSESDDGYFTKASVDGAETALSPPKDFELHVTPGGALKFGFAQAFVSPVPLGATPLRFQVRDPSAFVDFRFARERFAEIDPPAAGCSVAREETQPPKGADPEALMRALIAGTATAAVGGLSVVCR